MRQPERVDDIGIKKKKIRYNEEVRWEILLLEPVSDGFLALCKDAPLTADKVEEALDELARAVRSSAGRWLTAFTAARFITWSTPSPGSGRAEVRLLFVFDAEREAIVLVAGDKAGRWRTWYAEAIPLAEERYAAYQREAEEEEEEE